MLAFMQSETGGGINYEYRLFLWEISTSEGVGKFFKVGRARGSGLNRGEHEAVVYCAASNEKTTSESLRRSESHGEGRKILTEKIEDQSPFGSRSGLAQDKARRF